MAGLPCLICLMHAIETKLLFNKAEQGVTSHHRVHGSAATSSYRSSERGSNVDLFEPHRRLGTSKTFEIDRDVLCTVFWVVTGRSSFLIQVLGMVDTTNGLLYWGTCSLLELLVMRNADSSSQFN
jgi:hypothetical protein